MFLQALKNTLETSSDEYIKKEREQFLEIITDRLKTDVELDLFEIWHENIKGKENKNKDYIRGYNDCVKEINKRFNNRKDIFVRNFINNIK